MKIESGFAAKTALGISILTIFYHLAIFGGIIPMELTWGGKLSTIREMLVLESVSILINTVVCLLLAGFLKIIRFPISPKQFQRVFLLLAILFLLNTIGNLFSENELEKIIFTPVTLILAYLFFNLSREKTNH